MTKKRIQQIEEKQLEEMFVSGFLDGQRYVMDIISLLAIQAEEGGMPALSAALQGAVNHIKADKYVPSTKARH